MFTSVYTSIKKGKNERDDSRCWQYHHLKHDSLARAGELTFPLAL
jgi:hypothetical protein